MAKQAKKTGGPKKPSIKKFGGEIAKKTPWRIVHGNLAIPAGRPATIEKLFKAIGEKIPYEFLKDVKKYFVEEQIPSVGVYIAHDSMGYPRYIGRGNIFSRLDARRKAQVLELAYFSFFIVFHKPHEREIETIMIRAAGPLLDFNNKKIRNDIQPADVRDFEPGTIYIERKYTRGQKKVLKKTKKKGA